MKRIAKALGLSLIGVALAGCGKEPVAVENRIEVKKVVIPQQDAFSYREWEVSDRDSKSYKCGVEGHTQTGTYKEIVECTIHRATGNAWAFSFNPHITPSTLEVWYTAIYPCGKCESVITHLLYGGSDYTIYYK